MPWALGLVGAASASWVAYQGNLPVAAALLGATAFAIGAFFVFGDPPPPKDDPGDPGGINFGR